jgi:crotonobetainyl-CoA:carnitine CoA-transferase CaiB-like acyl-CoA transferase
MQPFAGIRVLDLTRVLAGPFCAYQLGLLGAEVIKVEPPGRGETIRRRAGGDPGMNEQGLSVGFFTQASNKRFLTLDLNQPAAREVFMKLAATCDVVVENLRTGAMDKRGVGYEAVRAVKPDIVWCAISAYGRTGPKQQHPAYDSVIQAYSGLMSVTGTKATGPLKAGPPVVDYATGMAAAFAVSSALFQRSRTGEGQYIDLSMLDTTYMLMASSVTAYMNSGKPPQPAGNDAASGAPASTTYETADGLLAIATNEEHQFRNLLKTAGLAALIDDPRFVPGAARRAHVPELRAELQAAFRKKSADEWERLLNEAGTPAGRVRTIPEAMAEAQTASRGFFHTFSAADSGVGREVTVPLSPFRYAHDGPQASAPAKPVGTDTDAILGELGYAKEAIAGLRASGVV